MPAALHLPLFLLVGGAVCFYVATQIAWYGFGRHRSAHGFARGMTLGIPVILIALILAFRGEPSAGLSLLTTGSVLMLTLALGSSALSVPEARISSSSFRILPPICAATCLIGFSGELRWQHAMAMGLIAIAMIGTVRTRNPKSSEPHHLNLILLGILIAAGGAVIMALGIQKLLGLSIEPLIAPAALPLVLLASIGLLVGDVHHGSARSAADTVTGFVITLLGIGIPLQIVAAHAIRALSKVVDADQPAIVMPVLSWRIDSVLLLTLSLLLLPAGFGRMRIGRLEGAFLVLVCIGYLMVTVTTGQR